MSVDLYVYGKYWLTVGDSQMWQIYSASTQKLKRVIQYQVSNQVLYEHVDTVHALKLMWVWPLLHVNLKIMGIIMKEKTKARSQILLTFAFSSTDVTFCINRSTPIINTTQCNRMTLMSNLKLGFLSGVPMCVQCIAHLHAITDRVSRTLSCFIVYSTAKITTYIYNQINKKGTSSCTFRIILSIHATNHIHLLYLLLLCR